jgi:hypothetical protein
LAEKPVAGLLFPGILRKNFLNITCVGDAGRMNQQQSGTG